MADSLYDRLKAMIRADPRFHDGLSIDDLDRADLCDERDGVLTFRIERHPHVLGRKSSGTRSSFFRRNLMEYRFDGVELSSSCIHTSVEWDVALLAQEEFDSLNADAGIFCQLIRQDHPPTRSEIEAAIQQNHIGIRDSMEGHDAGVEFHKPWAELYPRLVAIAFEQVSKEWREEHDQEVDH
ncbi:MAG: hypothetical protein IPP14_05770 [Planctomycetes bacterium]|nr:hypothetical protein [Planctomycetota bacterium]